MEIPTAALVREWALPFDFATIGYPVVVQPDPPEPAVTDPLDLRVGAATSYLEGKTCRRFDDTLPANLVPLAQMAVVMAAQRYAMLSNRDARQLGLVVGVGPGWIKSFRAGDYQETRLFAAELRKAGTYDFTRIDPWDELAELILAIATPECRAAMLEDASGIHAPAAGILETDASGENWPGDPFGVYGYGGGGYAGGW